MNEVVIAGIGQTSVGEHWDISLRELAFMAIEPAIQDAGGLTPQALFVGNMLAPILSGQAHLATLVADFAGYKGIEAVSVESAGASGAAALRLGYMAIRSGMVDVALVVGVEKQTDSIGSKVEAALSAVGDSDYESIHGMTPTAQAALLMQRYLYEYDLPRDVFVGFPLVAHANGVANPNAMFRKAIRPELYAKVGIVSDPLNMFDIAPFADGSAALVLTRSELLPEGFPHPLIRIAGSSQATGTLALHARPEPLVFQAAQTSTQRACHQAQVSSGDVDLFELHDAYSIFAALSLEAAGFAERGQGWKLAHEGMLGINGFLPISTMGGLKARGYPGGATGIYQSVEAVIQLRGQAGANQVPNARRALVQSLGGPASSAVTHIFEVC